MGNVKYAGDGYDQGLTGCSWTLSNPGKIKKRSPVSFVVLKKKFSLAKLSAAHHVVLRIHQLKLLLSRFLKNQEPVEVALVAVPLLSSRWGANEHFSFQYCLFE